MFRQIISGVKHLHSLGVAHRDLSLENTLINSDGHLKISDFGVACDNVDLIPASPSRPGKYQYMSPEIFSGQSYSPSANDIWSCAVMLFILSVGAPPFTQPRPCEASFNLIFHQRGGVRQVADAYSGWNHRFSDQPMIGDPERRSMRPPPFRLSDELIGSCKSLIQFSWFYLNNVSNNSSDLLDGMFRPQAQRLTLAQIIQHPWMLDTEDIDDVAVLQQQRQMAISAANLLTERHASDDKSSFSSTEAQPHTPIHTNTARIPAQDDLIYRQKALFDRLWKASSQDRHRTHSGQAVHSELALQPRSRSHKRPANELNSDANNTRMIAPVSQSVLSIYRSAVAHSVVASQVRTTFLL
jgi:serine/threonine protein kinase